MTNLDIHREVEIDLSRQPQNNSERLKLELKLKGLAEQIEDFDNSNVAGAKPISSNSSLDEILANGLLLLKHKDFGLAENLFSRVLKDDCYNILAIRGLAHCYRGLGRLEQAIKCCRSALDIKYCFSTQAMLAEMLYEYGQYQEALNEYSQLLDGPLEEGQALFEAYKNIGNIFVRSGDLDHAEEFYNKAYAMDPESDTLFVNLGTLEIQRGQLALALERFRQAVTLNRENDKAWVGLAMIHREFSDRELAWANIERALDVNRDNETAIRLAVDWSFQDGRISEIMERLELYLEQNQNDHVMRFVLAKMLSIGGRYPQAQLELHFLAANGFVDEEFEEFYNEINNKVDQIYK